MTVDAQLPHPFFDNQFRAGAGDDDGDPQRGRRARPDRLGDADHGSIRLLVTAGPSVFNVRQSLVTGVEAPRPIRYDTAAFKGATNEGRDGQATGFNAASVVFWMFSPNIGRGGMVQITRARVKCPRTMDARSRLTPVTSRRAAGCGCLLAISY